MGTRWRRGLSTRCAALDWNGEIPFRTAGNDEQASSVATPADGKPAETKKARSVVALSRVPRGERGAPVSPPAAGQVVSELRRSQRLAAISLRAAVRPLVRMPTDRHTATGTCEIGQFAHISDMQLAIARIFFRNSPLRKSRGCEFLKRNMNAARRQPRVVNGSTRCALRTNATMTAMPPMKKMPCTMCTPYVPQLQLRGDRPAAGKGRAEHLGADQDRRADDGHHVLPRNLAVAGEGGSCSWQVMAIR